MLPLSIVTGPRRDSLKVCREAGVAELAGGTRAATRAGDAVVAGERAVAHELEDAELVREMKATVKAHNEFNGVRQTVLTRCTVTVRETKPEPEHPAYSGEANEAFDMFWEYCEA